MKRTLVTSAAMLLALGVVAGCGRGDRERGRAAGEAQARIHADLGTLKVANGTDEPVAVYLNGQELYSVPPGRQFTFRNLPTGRATIYGVGRISQKHYGLPELEIEKGKEYEWKINP